MSSLDQQILSRSDYRRGLLNFIEQNPGTTFEDIFDSELANAIIPIRIRERAIKLWVDKLLEEGFVEVNCNSIYSTDKERKWVGHNLVMDSVIRDYVKKIILESFSMTSKKKILNKLSIKKQILESLARAEFLERWLPHQKQEWEELDPIVGTFHKDKLKQVNQKSWHDSKLSDQKVEELFKAKRDLKRLWNEIIDNRGLRSFWENNPDIVYFHSLAYYGMSVDELQTDLSEDPYDMTTKAFLKKYKLRGNKDELSTFGVYKGKSKAVGKDRTEGFLVKGRVTYAERFDAWTESRSKGSPIDIKRHMSSGLPKRPMPRPKAIQRVVFDESDIPAEKGLGECVLDNWSIYAYVISDELRDSRWREIHWCHENGIKVLRQSEVFK